MKRFTLLILLIIIVNSCARVSSPMGGPEDETAPILLESIPDNQQTNYTGNTVTLIFDEWIKTTNIESDLIITPKIETGFKTRIKKQQLQLTFNEPFRENTTYTLSFASTITDITNDNPIVGLTLSFATGAVLDSLEISGNVTNLYEQEPAEKFLVSLYTENDSLNILDGAAAYYTKTDTLGKYKFQNLPQGEYRIYAVNDKNNNSKADTEEERFGFYPDTLTLSESRAGIDFTVQNLNVDVPRVTSARPFAHYYDIEVNKPITSFDIVENNSANKSYINIGENKFRFFNESQTFNDTTQMIINLVDSAGYELRDTVNYYFIESKLEKEEFKVTIEPTNGLLKPVDSVVFEFTKPVDRINLDSIYIELDTLQTQTITSEELIWNDKRNRLVYKTDNKSLYAEGRKGVMLRIQPSAFISIEQDTLEDQPKYLAPLQETEIASIEGEVFTDNETIIVQLLNSRTRNIIATTTNKKYRFNYLGPGQYYVRVIEDLNGNGRWDIGNILTGETPEPAHYYYDNFYKTRLIELRKRWEQVDINISF